MTVLHQLEEEHRQKSDFEYIPGEIDNRTEDLKDVPLFDGFQTQCGIKGGKLSGGQKQRIAIARTIIRQPRVLILDEATSALDEESQQRIQQAMQKIKKGRTMIIIAHRYSTVKMCDKIFVVEHGKIKEEGTFNEMKNAGYFFTRLTADKGNKKVKTK